MFTYRFPILVFLCLTLWLVACRTEVTPTPAPTPRLVTATPLPTEIAQATATDEPLPTATATKIPPTPTAVPTATPTKAVISFYPNDPIAATYISLEFADAVDEASVETAFSLTPDTPGAIRWEGKKLIFEPTAGVLQPQTTYLVEIATTALTSSGEKLFNEPYRWSFGTALQKQSEVVSFGEGLKYQVIDAQGPRQILFGSTVSQVQAQLLKMETAQFVEIYQTDEDKLDVAPIYPVVHTWTIETPQETEDGGGIPYYPVYTLTLPAEAPPGIYLLTVGETLYEVEQLVVIITNQLLVMKQADKQFDFWLSTTENQPVSGATFTIYGQDKQVLTSGQTDEFGFFEAELNIGQVGFYETKVEKDQPLFALAEANGQVALIGFSEFWNQAWEYEFHRHHYISDDNKPYKVHFFSDKAVYRPGETVHYQAIIRFNDDAVLTTPPVNTPFSVRVWGRGLPNSTYIITQDSNQLTDLMLDGEVTEYLSDEFGTINGSFVIPAEGAHVGYEIQLLLYERPADWEPYWYWDGNPHVNVPVIQTEQNYLLTVNMDKNSFVEGEQATVTVNVTDLTGQPAPNLPLTFQTVIQGSYFDGYYSSDEVTPTLKLPNGQTDTNGNYQFTFSPIFNDVDEVYSWLLIASVGEEGKPANATGGQFYLVNGGINSTSPSQNNNPSSYTAGTTAQFTILSEVAGQAWLTVERGTVRRQQLVQLTPPNTILSLPIEPEDAPNIYVGLGMWEVAQASQTHFGRYNVETPQDAYWVENYQELSVNTGKLLNVDVVSDKGEYRPGETATFNIQVTDLNGQPVAAAVTLAVTDITCTELNPTLNPNPSIFNTFYHSRNALIKTFTSIHYRILNSEPSYSGGIEPTTPESFLIPCQNSAGWLPNIQTDANGQASVQLTLPNQVVNWQVTATAVTAETQVGQTAVEITVKP